MAEVTKEKKTFWRGTGRRKTSVARVRIWEGTGQITVNDRPVDEFFTEEKDRAAVLGPLLVTGLRNRVDVAVRVHGGGFTGQGGATSQGVARAIKEMFTPGEGKPTTTIKPELPTPAKPATPPTAVSEDEEGEEQELVPETPAKPETPEDGPIGLIKLLRDSGYLTRDSRMKERKKYGRKGARKSFQFSKR